MNQFLCLKRFVFLCVAIGCSATTAVAHASDSLIAVGPVAPDATRKFLQTHCYDCHVGKDSAAGLDLSILAEPGSSGEAMQAIPEVWTRIVDRVQAGEMPPDGGALTAKESEQFIGLTGRWLRDHQLSENKTLGRVKGRRLTNLQLERSLHDLLGIDIPLASGFSDEQHVGGFTSVAEGQAMSHFQIQQHLRAVDLALDEAFRRITTPADRFDKTFGPDQICKRRPGQRNREPEMRDGLAAVWASKLIFYGRMEVTRAPEDGWYRFTIRASSIKQPSNHGVWCSVRSGPCVSSAPLLETLGGFEATDVPGEWTFEGWLPKGHMLEVRPADATLSMARFEGGQVGAGEGEPQNVPGVAIHSVRMERIHRGPDDSQIKSLLLGDLAVRIQSGKRLEVMASDPKIDSAKLISTFAKRAFRRPVTPAEVEPYIAAVHQSLDDGHSFADAVRGGYRALLCSPRFLYFNETPGLLDNHAIATRLSYYLWNRMPDQTLIDLADAGKLRSVDVIKQQVGRMLDDPRGKDFVVDFAAQWLDLRDIDFTEPDPRIHRDFDPIVQQSMLQETHQFLQKMLDENLSVRHLIDSDFAMLNSRLARFYDIPGVSGDQVRSVSLKPSDRRGGLLTQGAILKITANGTSTSPVIRGVWISERLLGEHIAEPPKNVPAIEPDIRGATSIRDQFSKHTANAECAVCHVKIDPPGFALENYDPSGKWRDFYKLPDGKKSKLPVDSSNRMPTGESFSNIEQFKKIVLKRPEKIARGLAEKLVTYGTGATIRFADRPAIDQIVAQSAKDDFGMRSIVESVATNILFVSK